MEVKHLACAKGHGERIWSVAWSPAADLFATCSSDCSVRLWSLQRRSEPSSARAHLCASRDRGCCADYEIVLEASIDKYFKKTVRSVRFSSGGEYLLCASFDGTATVWAQEREESADVVASSPTLSTPSTAGAPRSDTSVANFCSGRQSWVCVAVLEGHENEVKCAAFDCTSTFIATCGRDKTVWIHQKSQYPDQDDIARGPIGSPGSSLEFFCAAILTGHTQDVKCVCWSPNALLLASASYDNSVRLWGLVSQDWLCIQTINIHSSTVWSVSFDPDGSRLAAVSADCSISVYKSRKAREYLDQLGEVQLQAASTSTMLKLGPIDTTFKYELARKTHKIRDFQLKNPPNADDWQPCHVIQSYHARPIYSVDFSALILTGGGDNMVRLMEPEEDGSCAKAEVAAHSSDVNCVAWRPNDPDMLFVTVGDDEYIKLWKVLRT